MPPVSDGETRPSRGSFPGTGVAVPRHDLVEFRERSEYGVAVRCLQRQRQRQRRPCSKRGRRAGRERGGWRRWRGHAVRRVDRGGEDLRCRDGDIRGALDVRYRRGLPAHRPDDPLRERNPCAASAVRRRWIMKTVTRLRLSSRHSKATREHVLPASRSRRRTSRARRRRRLSLTRPGLQELRSRCVDNRRRRPPRCRDRRHRASTRERRACSSGTRTQHRRHRDDARPERAGRHAGGQCRRRADAAGTVERMQLVLFDDGPDTRKLEYLVPVRRRVGAHAGPALAPHGEAAAPRRSGPEEERRDRHRNGVPHAKRPRHRISDRRVLRALNHLHLLVEADDNDALAGGMKSFTVRANCLFNAASGRRRGRVWAGRYHRTDLKTPRQSPAGAAR